MNNTKRASDEVSGTLLSEQPMVDSPWLQPLFPGTIAFLILVASCAGTIAAAEVPQKATAAVSGTSLSHCVVETTAKGPVRRCALVVAVRTPRASTPESITLPIEVKTVTQAAVTPLDHLVVIGKDPDGYDTFVVYSLYPTHLVATDICYSPSLSPDGSWLAYQRFIPPHGMEPVSVDIKLLAVDARSEKPSTVSVYQSGAGEWPMDVPHWSANSAWLLFGTIGEKEDTLVLVDIYKRQARSLSLNLADLCLNNLNETGKCQLTIEHVAFSEAGSEGVQVTFRRFGNRGYDQKTVNFAYNEFKPIDSQSSVGGTRSNPSQPK